VQLERGVLALPVVVVIVRWWEEAARVRRRRTTRSVLLEYQNERFHRSRRVQG